MQHLLLSSNPGVTILDRIRYDWTSLNFQHYRALEFSKYIVTFLAISFKNLNSAYTLFYALVSSEKNKLNTTLS